MPKFSETSSSRLETCHLDLQLIFNEVVRHFDCSILCGYRSKDSQEAAFNQGLSQLRYPQSKHNSIPSMAVDVAPYFVELKNVDWKDEKAFAFFAGYVNRVAEQLLKQKIITHRLRWGGDWDGDRRTLDERFKDLPHFELIPA